MELREARAGYLVEAEQRVPKGYKQTEVGVIPEDWEAHYLGELLDSAPAYGINAPAIPYDSRYPTYLRITDISEDGRFIDESKASVKHPLSGSYMLSGGDLVFARTGASVGKSYLYDRRDGELVFAGFLIRARPDTKKLEPKYLKYFTHSRPYWNWIKVNSMRSGQPGINGREYASLLIPLPPTKAEQEAIAEALSDADALIESLEQLIAKKRHIKQGAMQELLTGKKRLPGFSGEWEMKRLGDVADANQKWSFTGGPFGSNLKSSDYVDDGVRIIQLQNIGDGEFHNDSAVFTSPEKADELLSCNIYPGEIILSKMGDPVARACIIPPYHERYLMCSDGIRLAVNPKKFNTYFVYISINAPDFRTRAENAGTGSTRKRIGLTQLRNLELLCPELPEQTAIAAILTDMDAEIAALEEKLIKTRSIKQGMMHNLLTGKIRLINSAIVKVEQHALLDVDSIPAAPKPDKSHNWAFNEAVVISVLADLFGKSDFPLGRKRYTKLSYLMHRKAEREAQGYLKKAAGPYNPKTKYAGPEKIAQEHGYMRWHEHAMYTGFIAAEKIEQAKTYFAKWYGPETIAWLKQFRYRSNDDLELLATVDMAMQELLKQGKAADVDSVRALIASEPEWLPKLERSVFSDSRIAAAIAECHIFFTK